MQPLPQQQRRREPALRPAHQLQPGLTRAPAVKWCFTESCKITKTRSREIRAAWDSQKHLVMGTGGIGPCLLPPSPRDGSDLHGVFW